MSARTKQIAKIHVAKKALALTDESYRDVLRRVTGRDSAASLDERGLKKVLDEFKRLGFRDPRPTSAKAQVRMIHGVWADLVAMGAVDAAEPAAALRAFVQRQTKTAANPAGVSAPEFLDAKQANRVLEGLKAWRKRARGAEAAA
jgi:phage gp16-like protein